MKRHTKITALSATILMAVTLTAFAQDGGGLKQELIKINNKLKNIGGFLVDSTNQLVTWTTDMMFELDPAMGAAIASNQQYFQTIDKPNKVASASSLGQLHERLTPKAKIYKTLGKLAFDVPSSHDTLPKELRQQVNIFGPRQSHQPQGKQCYYKYLKKLKKNKNLHADNFYNFSTLSKPSGFDKNSLSECQAKTFIQFLSSMNPQIENNLSRARKKIQQKLQGKSGSEAWKMYKSLRQDKDLVDEIYRARSKLASRSVGLNNLYYMLAERERIKGAGQKAGMQQKDASPLEIKEHAANQRVKSKKWYREMSKASPATVNREMLFILAEIRQQMHEMHKDNERLMATMSSMSIMMPSAF